MSDPFTTMLSVLADAPKNTGPDFGKASPFGLLIVVILLICVFILVWSMNKHLKKLPESFDTEPAPDSRPGSDDAVSATTEESAASERDVKRPPHEPGG